MRDDYLVGSLLRYRRALDALWLDMAMSLGMQRYARSREFL